MLRTDMGDARRRQSSNSSHRATQRRPSEFVHGERARPSHAYVQIVNRKCRNETRKPWAALTLAGVDSLAHHAPLAAAAQQPQRLGLMQTKKPGALVIKAWIPSILSIVLLASSSIDAAQESQGVTAKIQKTLETRLPNLKIEKIQPSQWPGLYEVVTESELVYSDATGNFLFIGNVMDTKTRDNLTAQRWNQMLNIDFNALPLNLAIKLVKGDGSRKLAVFSDPHCPYCVRFEKTLKDIDNVTVYTFLYPIESLHPSAVAKAKDIWCAKDRYAAWTAWMMDKKDTPAGDCKSDAVDKVVELGEKLKVSGTPTLFFADGRRIPGAVGKEQLEEEFKKAPGG